MVKTPSSAGRRFRPHNRTCQANTTSHTKPPARGGDASLSKGSLKGVTVSSRRCKPAEAEHRRKPEPCRGPIWLAPAQLHSLIAVWSRQAGLIFNKKSGTAFIGDLPKVKGCHAKKLDPPDTIGRRDANESNRAICHPPLRISMQTAC
jgi:hypothetical protein